MLRHRIIELLASFFVRNRRNPWALAGCEMLSRAKAAASRHAQSRDRDTYVQPSPPLSDDVYAEPIPEPVQTLIAYLQQAGPRTPELFGGDPSVRAINDLLDGLAAEPSPSVERLARGDAGWRRRRSRRTCATCRTRSCCTR